MAAEDPWPDPVPLQAAANLCMLHTFFAKIHRKLPIVLPEAHPVEPEILPTPTM